MCGKTYKVLKGGLVLVMIGVFGLVQFNRIANLHYHHDESGILFSHSHPYNKSDDNGPIKTHGHGKYFLSILTGVTEISIPGVAYVLLIFPFALPSKTLRGIPLGENPEHYILRGRAPPFFTI